MKLRYTQLLVVLLTAGCASVTTHKDPSANLNHVKTVFVERRLGDDHHLDQLITNELQSLGLQVTNGPSTMQPDRVDAVVAYTDRWEWDFKSHLIEFNLIVRDGHNEKPLAEITYYHPSMLNQSPEKMLHEVLPPLFKKNHAVQSKVTISPLRDPAIPDSVRESIPAAKP